MIDDLIEENIGLLVSILQKYYLVDDPQAESLAYEALWRACEDFDESLGFQRSTLITVYIQRALGSYIRTLNKQRQIRTVSYYNTAYTQEGVEYEFIRVLPTEQTTDSGLIKECCNEQVRDAYEKVLATFSGNKKRIVDCWAESDFEATNQTIAERVGVSQPYVNQILGLFKREMRTILKEDLYD